MSFSFSGINALSHCTTTNINTPNAYETMLPYYFNYNQNNGIPFCLQCCGNSPVKIDTWSFDCALNPVTAVETNIYGYEFRFEKKVSGPNDVSQIVSCPIKRSACNYTESGALIACSANDATYLQSYTLTINVAEYDQNFLFWRGVNSCSVETVEVNQSLANSGIFQQTIILRYSAPYSVSLDGTRWAFLSLFSIVILFALLFLLRKQVCVVCQKRLILCFHRCFICRLVGADVNPELIRMLADKGAILQGRPRRWRSSTVKVAALTTNGVEEGSDHNLFLASLRKESDSGSLIDGLKNLFQSPSPAVVPLRNIREVPSEVWMQAVGHPLAPNIPEIAQ